MKYLHNLYCITGGAIIAIVAILSINSQIIFASTHYSTNQYQDETLSLMQTHIKVMKWTYTAPSPKSADDTFGLQTIQSMQILWQVTLAVLFVNAKGANQKALNQHIQDHEKLINQASIIEQNHQEKIQLLRIQMTECNQEKAVGDAVFSQWIQEKNNQKITQGIQLAWQNSACANKAKIELNAYAILSKKLEQRRQLLTQKKDLMIYNQELILDNIQYFTEKNYTLEQVIQLKKSLNALQRANDQIQ